MSHYNIPIFTPQLACPHCCIFCNQKHISGQLKAPKPEDVRTTIEQYLSTIKEGSEVEVAFFGGSFTCLDSSLQEAYLKEVQPYIKEGRVQAIRLSTRPDYIDRETLDRLQHYNVLDIELGAQSLDDEVLQYSERGHSVEDVEKASELINFYGFNLGLQMMIGLPLDTLDKSIYTAKKILSLNAKSTRIYPTLVIEHTTLAKLYREGKYSALSIPEAIEWTKEIYKIFSATDITILRVGLHPSKDILSGKGFLAGPFHVSFFELVLSSLWKDKIQAMPQGINELHINPVDVNYVVGYKSSNKPYLQSLNPQLKIIQDTSIAKGDFLAV